MVLFRYFVLKQFVLAVSGKQKDQRYSDHLFDPSKFHSQLNKKQNEYNVIYFWKGIIQEAPNLH